MSHALGIRHLGLGYDSQKKKKWDAVRNWNIVKELFYVQYYANCIKISFKGRYFQPRKYTRETTSNTRH
jgi:hypothetical protein